MSKNEKRILTIRKRCKVERLGKLITGLAVVLVLTIGHIFDFEGYYLSLIVVSLWFGIPDLVVYVLEKFYHIEHKQDVYR